MVMKKKMFSILTVVLLLLSFNTNVFAEEGLTSNVYSVTPDDKEWATFTSKEQMLEATRISQDDLQKMSTEQLIDAVLNYPLIINIYLYDSYEVGLKALAQDSDAYSELLKRDDSADLLLSELNLSRTSQEESLNQLTISILLTDNIIWNKLSDKGLATEHLAAYTSSTVYTPNGSSVPVIIRGEELTPLQKFSIDADAQGSYPNATYVSNSTSNYNCHSYAWYSQTTTNTYWMNNPGAYMTDGSYTSFTSLLNAVAGTRVYYGSSADHSAVVYQYGGPLASTKKLKVISKWGLGPLMQHAAEYAPYASNNLTMWKN